ncbi:rluB [Symbiodinium necroappetens]|uniref:RluB protein n=1 Tax=Symbiodinium necroappetens TaxID=1628268 RepID=A0A812Y771_9DINO|nr:rluB [Symbiodinium necroappetens]
MAAGSSRGVKRELDSGEPEEAQGDQDESESIVAFALYKPRPMITDMTKGGMGDIARRMCPTRPPKPVGQLDRCTTGLMIFTTNGRLTCHLNSHVSKTYRAWYDGWTSSNGRSSAELTDEQCQQLREGICLSRGDGWANFETVQRRECEELPSIQLPTGEKMRKFRYCADVRISSGKFHVVKRLFMSVGKSVIRLHRLEVAGLSLEKCGLERPGDFVQLSDELRDSGHHADIAFAKHEKEKSDNRNFEGTAERGRCPAANAQQAQDAVSSLRTATPSKSKRKKACKKIKLCSDTSRREL